MDWIVFGDDWGIHPSTTQHLMLNVPKSDKVIWFDSIGMRTPELNFNDLSRIGNKLKNLLNSKPDGQERRLYQGSLQHFLNIQPRVIPLHRNPIAQSFNKKSLGKSATLALKNLAAQDSVLLTVSPVLSLYKDSIPHNKLVYLRLDVYDQYPGCDPILVKETEAEIYEKADAIVVTAESLRPGEPYEDKTYYLPQGVQYDHFTKVSLQPKGKKILGFFGTLSEWIDYDLIEQVAKRSPDWELEFIGKVDYLPEKIRSIPNIKLIDKVPFDELPNLISNWTAAWIPFVINELTLAVNPLKIREYLAAGLASHSTPMPEIKPLADHVMISHDANEIVNWMKECHLQDSYENREKRRLDVKTHSWESRCLKLRDIINSL